MENGTLVTDVTGTPIHNSRMELPYGPGWLICWQWAGGDMYDYWYNSEAEAIERIKKDAEERGVEPRRGCYSYDLTPPGASETSSLWLEETPGRTGEECDNH